MFLRYYVELPVPAPDVEAVLLGSPAAWLPELADDARAHGQRLLAETGLETRAAVIAPGGTISVGRAVRFPSKLAIPMTWQPARAEVLLPNLEADLEAGALGPARTQLAINASYTPPLGAFGRTVDRLLLHRVAEATLKRFLDQVADRIVKLAGARLAVAPTSPR